MNSRNPRKEVVTTDLTEPTETDLARWAKWDDLRARQKAATTDAEREALKREEDQLRDASITELLMQDVGNEARWIWLSFVDPKKDEFLGVAIVRAGGILEATLEARRLGCNPGGEVQGWPIKPEFLPGPEYRGRLLTKDEALSIQEP